MDAQENRRTWNAIIDMALSDKVLFKEEPIRIVRDKEAGVWIATCEEIPELKLQDSNIDSLIQRVEAEVSRLDAATDEIQAGRLTWDAYKDRIHDRLTALGIDPAIISAALSDTVSIHGKEVQIVPDDTGAWVATCEEIPNQVLKDLSYDDLLRRIAEAFTGLEGTDEAKKSL